MKKIAFIYDEYSKVKAEEVLEELCVRGINLNNNGVFTSCYGENNSYISSELFALLEKNDYVIGISSSGNGFAMLINESEDVSAAPISVIDDVVEAINDYGVKFFDIASTCDNIVELCEKVVYEVEHNEME